MVTRGCVAGNAMLRSATAGDENFTSMFEKSGCGQRKNKHWGEDG